MTANRPEVPLTVITPDDVRASIRRARKSLVDAANEVVWQIEMEAWRTLGYPSWTAMREAEYGGVAFMVPSKDRPELVARIREAGLTQREAAATAGVTEQTIYNDERKARDPKYLGRTQAEDDVIDAEVIEDDEPQVDTKTGEVSDDYVTDQADLDAAPELPDEGVPAPKPETQNRPDRAMNATEAERDRQHQEAQALARALVTLSAFQHAQARQRYRESWAAQPYSRGLGEPYYNPTTIRQLAKSLTTFADELGAA